MEGEGELLTRITVRIAMVLYVASLASRGFTPRWSRLSWTLGCGFYLLHVVCAFEYYHHWSHPEAYADTAKKTAAVVGLDWGGGLYVNYAFTFVWLADVIWWWMRDGKHPHPPPLSREERGVAWAVQGFMGFIAFNATVIFASGWSRWFGMVACLLLAGIWVCRLKGKSHHG